MKVRIWGLRGSIPVPGPGTLRYGGNTPCVQVEVPLEPGSKPTYVIFDAGSGIRLLGNQMMKDLAPGSPAEIHLLLTHVHWDHIQGLPFFKPLYRAGSTISLYGPDYPNLEGFIQHQMYPNYFPISMDHTDVKADIRFRPLDKVPLRVGQAEIHHRPVNHASEGTALGYRVESSAGAFVFIPDVEPADFPRPGASRPIIDETNQIERDLIDFVHGADFMLFDSTYTNEEYERCRGWGHSPVDYTVELAAKAGVRRLGLYHYDPMREDDEMDRVAEKARQDGLAKGVDVIASREGMVVEIGN